MPCVAYTVPTSHKSNINNSLGIIIGKLILSRLISLRYRLTRLIYYTKNKTSESALTKNLSSLEIQNQVFRAFYSKKINQEQILVSVERD